MNEHRYAKIRRMPEEEKEKSKSRAVVDMLRMISSDGVIRTGRNVQRGAVQRSLMKSRGIAVRWLSRWSAAAHDQRNTPRISTCRSWINKNPHVYIIA